MAHGIDDNNGGIGKGRGIDDASEGSEITTEAVRICGQRRRLQRRDDGPEKLATTTEEWAEEDDPEESTTTTKASAEEAEETTRLSERLRR